MERQLRLAERRGLLKGSRLSPVQSFGLELVIFLEGLDKQIADDRDLRLAMAASGLYNIRTLFPGLGDGKKDTPANNTSNNAEEDYSGVVWQSPNDPDAAISLEELKRLIRSNDKVSVPSTAESFEGSDWQ